MNNQKPLPVTTQPKLVVHRIFRSIQGEGPFVGMPAVFIRFFGCNIACPECDTDYSSAQEELTPRQILNRVTALQTGGLVVLTGGEPLRQSIGDLVSTLASNGFKIQIETNGTVYQSLPWGQVTLVCSPKTSLLNPLIVERTKYYKYVIEAGKVASDGLPQTVMGFPFTGQNMVARPPAGNKHQVYLMPLDNQDPLKNKANIETAVKSCTDHGYRLCIQIHKMIGVE